MLKSLKIFSLLLLLTAILACGTDVPLSYNTRLSDDRLLGYWQADPESGISIQRSSDGKLATMIFYEYNEEQARFVPMTEKPLTIYFTALKDGKEEMQFLSVNTGDDKPDYTTNRIDFSADGKLSLTGISYNFMKTEHGKVEDDVVLFGKPKHFQKFVQQHLKNSALYEEAVVFERRNDLHDFQLPSKS